MEKKGLYNIYDDGERVINLKGFIVGLLLFPIYIYGLPLLMQYAFEAAGIGMSQVMFNLCYYVVMMIIVLLLYGRFLFDSLKGVGKTAPVYWWIAAPILGLMGVFAGNVAAADITQVLVDRPQSENNEVIVSFFGELPVVVILMTVVFAPIIEETIFRAVFFRPIARLKYGKIFAYVLVCLMFASIHVVPAAIANNDPTELYFLVSYLPAALSLALVYSKVKNIWASIALHAAVNAIGMLGMAA